MLPERNLLPLVLIHASMGCPLAIVTADRFAAHILLKNVTLFLDPINNITIGLPLEAMRKMEETTAMASRILKTTFGAMAMERGTLKPSIDCALLSMNNGSPPEVWKATPDPAGIAVYFKVDERSLKALENRGINVSACTNATTICEQVRKTAECIADAVFEEVRGKDVPGNSIESRFNPVLSALQATKANLRNIRVVRAKREFDPFALLHEAGVL